MPFGIGHRILERFGLYLAFGQRLGSFVQGKSERAGLGVETGDISIDAAGFIQGINHGGAAQAGHLPVCGKVAIKMAVAGRRAPQGGVGVALLNNAAGEIFSRGRLLRGQNRIAAAQHRGQTAVYRGHGVRSGGAYIVIGNNLRAGNLGNRRHRLLVIPLGPAQHVQAVNAFNKVASVGFRIGSAAGKRLGALILLGASRRRDVHIRRQGGQKVRAGYAGAVLQHKFRQGALAHGKIIFNGNLGAIVHGDNKIVIHPVK